MAETEPLDRLAAVVDFVEQEYKRFKKARMPFEKRWYSNMAFTMGKHYLDWSPTANRLIEYPTPSYRVKLVVNYIWSIWRILLAKIMRIEPTLYVMPAKGDEESKEAADLGFKFLTYLWRINRMDMNLNRFVSRGIIYGTAFFMPFFNKKKGAYRQVEDSTEEDGQGRIPWMDNLGKRVTDEESGKPLFLNVDEKGEPKTLNLQIGEADVDIWDPLEFYPCPEATDDPETLTSFIREKQRTVQWVEDIYGMKINPTSTYETNDISRQIGSLLETNVGSEERTKDAVTVKDLFVLPNKKYPKGRIVTTAGGHKVPLQDTELPSEYLKIINLPIVWRFVSVPGSFWGATIIEQITPLNVQLNKARSRVIEHANTVAKGKWMIPTQSHVDVPITDEPGQKIRYLAGTWPMPQQAQLAPLPAYVFESIAALTQEIYDVSGVHEVSHSRTPRGVRSGKAIAALQEMDDTSIAPTIKDFGEALEQLGIAWLHIGKVRYTEKRLITVVGKNFRDYIEDFHGAMLEDAADVVCQMGSELPQSKLARQELYLELARLRVIDPKKLLQLLDLEDDMQSKDRLDESKAAIENDDMTKGIVKMVSLVDNHFVHNKIHEDFQKQPLFEKLPDQVKYIHKLHIQSHTEHIKTGAMTESTKMDIQAKLMGSLPNLPQGKKKG